MPLRPRLARRQYLIIAHDLVATAAAIVLTFVLRFDGIRLAAKLQGLWLVLPPFLIYAAVCYCLVGLQRNKGRFPRVPVLMNIVRASTILAVSLLALDYVLVAPNALGEFFFGKVTILLYWLMQMFLLAGGLVAYRYYHHRHPLQRVRNADAVPALILGRAADAEVLLRGIESGAVTKIWPVAILSPSANDRAQAIRRVPVLGDLEDMEAVVGDLAGRGTRIARLLLTPSAMTSDARPEAILVRARKLGIQVNQVPSLDSAGAPVRLAPVSVEDLLLRPTASIDYGRLESLVAGKSVVVTGGGGSISAEICSRVVTFGASRLLVIENSEPALHTVLEALALSDSGAEASGRIADIRDRARIMHLIAEFKPDLLFHDAAHKHVPLLERA